MIIQKIFKRDLTEFELRVFFSNRAIFVPGPHVFSPTFAFDFYLQRPRNHTSGTRKRKDGYWILVARTAECCDHRYIQRYEIPWRWALSSAAVPLRSLEWMSEPGRWILEMLLKVLRLLAEIADDRREPDKRTWPQLLFLLVAHSHISLKSC